MRIQELFIERWRNFRNVRFEVPTDSTLVCLVGENGTGKSNVLELLSAAAPHLGISAGVEQRRGDPFQEVHGLGFNLSLELEDPVSFVGSENLGIYGDSLTQWDGTLRFTSSRDEDGTLRQGLVAGGVAEENQAQVLASHLVSLLRQRKETQHLYIDADRAYPPFAVAPHQYAEILGQPWETPEWNLQFAFRPTKTLYEEWIKYFLAREGKEATEFFTASRRAALQEKPQPNFVDPFGSYRESVEAVLPHLEFVGVDTQNRELLFDTVGLPLSFSRLSGGEREIAFILGQVERFRLRRGLLLLDEPELHLNPDLLRTWLAFLRDTVDEGQVWIATHALEAVEVTGPESTFVLERTGAERTVEAVSPLGERPVVRILSAAVGAPAFSITNRRFIWVEGDRHSGERERFYKICGDPVTNRFLEGGGCVEVARKLAAVADLAEMSEEELRVGAVIDHDFRTDQQLAAMTKMAPVFVLGCHEIENFFLHPDALEYLSKPLGGDRESALGELVKTSDSYAGLWILRRATTEKDYLPQPERELRKLAGGFAWSHFEEDVEGTLQAMVHVQAMEPGLKPEFLETLRGATEAYANVRQGDSLWKECLGKEVLGRIPRAFGLSGATALEQHVIHAWEDGRLEVPEQVVQLREYVASI